MAMTNNRRTIVSCWVTTHRRQTTDLVMTMTNNGPHLRTTHTFAPCRLTYGATSPVSNCQHPFSNTPAIFGAIHEMRVRVIIMSPDPPVATTTTTTTFDNKTMTTNTTASTRVRAIVHARQLPVSHHHHGRPLLPTNGAMKTTWRSERRMRSSRCVMHASSPRHVFLFFQS